MGCLLQFFLLLVQVLIHVPLVLGEEGDASIHVSDFVASALQGNIHRDAMWIINLNFPVVNDYEHRDELLFVVDQTGSSTFHCPMGCRRGEDCSQSGAIPAVGLIGYYRPGAMERYCLWQDGILDSFMSRRRLRVATVGPAPTLKDMVAQIDALGPEHTCVPPAHRGILFETMELLCFALGHKPAVIRQRQMHGGDNLNGIDLLSGVPANLFVPHTRVLLEWLLAQPHERVWRGLSHVQWEWDGGRSHRPDPPFENAIVLAHSHELGQHLMELRVQDASVPYQGSVENTANYIAHVGAALGYSFEQVQHYLETANVIPSDGSVPREVLDNALADAFGHNCGTGDDAAKECPQKQQYQELENFRAFLESPKVMNLSPQLMRQLVEPMDALFLI